MSAVAPLAVLARCDGFERCRWADLRACCPKLFGDNGLTRFAWRSGRRVGSGMALNKAATAVSPNLANLSAPCDGRADA